MLFDIGARDRGALLSADTKTTSPGRPTGASPTSKSLRPKFICPPATLVSFLHRKSACTSSSSGPAMSNSVAIVSPRDNVPAQRLLLCAIVAALIFALPGLAHGKTRGKPARSNFPAVSRPAPPVKPVAAPGAVATVSLRAANDGIAPKAAVDPTTTGLVGGLTVGRASNASADATGPQF